MTAPLSDRMRQAASTIEELNARDGLGLNCTVSPKFLREEAEKMENRR
jgi:hypothetical protein